MAWAKPKIAAVAAAAMLATWTMVVLVTKVVSQFSPLRARLPAGGSTLILNRVAFDGTNVFLHGNEFEKILRNAIPAKGLQLAKLKLARPTAKTFQALAGKSWLVAEFKLTGTNLASHSLVNLPTYREFRCVIRGERGIDYVYGFWPGQFRNYSDGYFGYVLANAYPRDSRWLWLQIERRANQDQAGAWSPVAQFKIENKSRCKIQTWSADTAPTIKRDEGMEFILGEITVVTQSYSTRDVWNHVVTTPFQVRSNGILLKNWIAAYARAEDASGNWTYLLASHQGLDPRYVWKLDVDFEPASDFPAGNVAAVKLPAPSTTLTTNFMNVPVTISWDGYRLEASIPKNRPDLALRFVCVADSQGEKTSEASGSWGQDSFLKTSFMSHSFDDLKPTTLTFAIVPNVHATFYAQPRLIIEQAQH